jgi:hypothetical protein
VVEAVGPAVEVEAAAAAAAEAVAAAAGKMAGAGNRIPYRDYTRR